MLHELRVLSLKQGNIIQTLLYLYGYISITYLGDNLYYVSYHKTTLLMSKLHREDYTGTGRKSGSVFYLNPVPCCPIP